VRFNFTVASTATSSGCAYNVDVCEVGFADMNIALASVQARGVAAASSLPNVFCKVSALVEGVRGEVGKAPADPGYYLPILDTLWEAFGPDRLIYGSNWPVSDRGAPYATIIGIVKAYTTRVGSGPFPTELDNDEGERLRQAGSEFGTTTGRPRRCGWYDAPIARYSARINGITDFVMTKLDVLTGLAEIPVCVAYEVDGVRFDEMPVNQSDFHHATPIYENFPGWTEDISGARRFEDLPVNAQNYVRAIESMSGARISAIGVGPARDEIIAIHDLLD
jgi:hypothetical protein